MVIPHINPYRLMVLHQRLGVPEHDTERPAVGFFIHKQLAWTGQPKLAGTAALPKMMRLRECNKLGLVSRLICSKQQVSKYEKLIPSWFASFSFLLPHVSIC